MRCFVEDLSRLRDAAEFMVTQAHGGPEAERYRQLLALVEGVCEEVQELDIDAPSFESSAVSLFSRLAEHGDEVEAALSTMIQEWSSCARKIAFAKGYLPKLTREESGNAYEVAEAYRSSRRFLLAALASAEPAHV